MSINRTNTGLPEILSSKNTLTSVKTELPSFGGRKRPQAQMKNVLRFYFMFLRRH